MYKLKKFVNKLDEKEKIFLTATLLMVRYQRLTREDAIEVAAKNNYELGRFIQKELKDVLKNGPSRNQLKI